MGDVKYIHEEVVHNFSAATEVVPVLLKMFNPESIVDVGCGIGTWLKVFKDNGISDILGIDGDYVDRAKLHIPIDNFEEYDLETPYLSDRKFGMAISLEVAEHLKPESADLFVKSLTSLSDLVIFSAAIPNQGGQNHINEAPPQYWIDKFASHGYTCFDVLRPIFWNASKIDAWYRQNMLVFSSNPEFEQVLTQMKTFDYAHLVHPEILERICKHNDYLKTQNDRFESGKKSGSLYLRLLLKKLKNKFS